MFTSNTSKNIASLSLINFTNQIVPLIVIPILWQKVGIDNYGLIVLAQSVMMIFVSIADFGLNITGITLISKYRDSQFKTNDAIILILSAKGIMLAMSFGVLLISIYLIPGLNKHALHYLLSFSIVIGQAFIPIWYYHGKEQMSAVMWINFFSKVLYLMSILFLVPENEQGYLYVNIYYGVTGLAVSAVFLLTLLRNIPIKIHSQSFSSIVSFLIQCKHQFTADVLSNLNRSSSMIIAGIIFNTTTLGLYSVVDKLIMFMRHSSVIIFQGLLPKASFLANDSMKSLFLYLRHYGLRFLLFALFVGLLINFLGSFVLNHFSYFERFVYLDDFLYLLSFLPIILTINAILSLTLVALNLLKHYSIFHLYGLLINTILYFYFGIHLGISGMIISVLITEILIISYAFLKVRTVYNYSNQ